ncbi:MAG: tRNA-dihydrouridine synthase family protein [Bacteroidota bacterium]|nr:tRNA-dihydrouridine synthase family protein [Bacteroidota bacterium]
MNNSTIILAPLQGLTDAVYRKVYSKYFSGIDIAYTPYISLNEKNPIKASKTLKLIDRGNVSFKVFPQLLTNKAEAIIDFAASLTKHKINNINLNMGCPYPIVTKKKKGAGMLPEPKLIDDILQKVFSSNFDSHLSIKLRLGFFNKNEIIEVINVLNNYPLSEIIIHPRIGTEYYTGKVDLDFFEKCMHLSKHTVIYNGDIFSADDYVRIKNRFPEITSWMLGRGILQNPWLPQQIKNAKNNYSEEVFRTFHIDLMESISDLKRDKDIFPQRMKEYWWYFAKSFDSSEKIFNQIKKINSKEEYYTTTENILTNHKWLY